MEVPEGNDVYHFSSATAFSMLKFLNL